MAPQVTEKDHRSILEYSIALLLTGMGVVIVGILILVFLTHQLESKVAAAQKAAEEARMAEIGARTALAALQSAQHPTPPAANSIPAPAPAPNHPPATPRKP